MWRRLGHCHLPVRLHSSILLWYLFLLLNSLLWFKNIVRFLWTNENAVLNPLLSDFSTSSSRLCVVAKAIRTSTRWTTFWWSSARMSPSAQASTSTMDVKWSVIWYFCKYYSISIKMWQRRMKIAWIIWDLLIHNSFALHKTAFSMKKVTFRTPKNSCWPWWIAVTSWLWRWRESCPFWRAGTNRQRTKSGRCSSAIASKWPSSSPSLDGESFNFCSSFRFPKFYPLNL